MNAKEFNTSFERLRLTLLILARSLQADDDLTIYARVQESNEMLRSIHGPVLRQSIIDSWSIVGTGKESGGTYRKHPAYAAIPTFDQLLYQDIMRLLGIDSKYGTVDPDYRVLVCTDWSVLATGVNMVASVMQIPPEVAEYAN